MQHDRCAPTTVFADIAGIQPTGHIEIDLHGAALPHSIQTIAQGKIDFRAVKRTFSGLPFPGQASLVQRQFQRLFRFVPDLIATDAFFRPVDKAIRISSNPKAA